MTCSALSFSVAVAGLMIFDMYCQSVQSKKTNDESFVSARMTSRYTLKRVKGVSPLDIRHY